jgi:hypothetical protein
MSASAEHIRPKRRRGNFVGRPFPRLRFGLVSRHARILGCHWLCQCTAYDDVNSQNTGVASGTPPEKHVMTDHSCDFPLKYVQRG